MVNSILGSRRAKKIDEMTLETRQMTNYLEFARESQTTDWLAAYHEITLYQQWNDYTEWNEKYGPISNPEAYLKFTKICEFFNTMGLLVKTGVINERIPYDQGADAIIGAWRKVEPLIIEMRKNSPGLWNTFEFFVKRCEDIRSKEKN